MSRLLVGTASIVCIALYLVLFTSALQAISGFARTILKRQGPWLVPGLAADAGHRQGRRRRAVGRGRVSGAPVAAYLDDPARGLARGEGR
jgi:hypothetical protein